MNEDDAVLKKSFLEAKLKEPDYILEPNCIETITEYVTFGGNPTIVVQFLSENYRALGQVVNLLAEWLITAGMKPEEVQEQVENHLQELVLKHFDPKSANEILTKNNSEIPEWLNNMIQFKKWRQTFYKLIEQYPDCLMLNFAIKLISNAGYQGEITNVKTACTQSEVFARVFRALLLEFVKESEFSGEENSLDFEITAESNHLTELCQLACHSEHTYFMSQSIIHTLTQFCNQHLTLLERKFKTSKKKKEIYYSLDLKLLQILRKVRQFLQREAHRRGHTHVVKAITKTHLRNKSDCQRRTLNAVYSAIGKGNIQHEDINELFSLYYENPTPPKVEYLQNPLLFDLMTSWLFSVSIENTGDDKFQDLRDKTIQLLAYASSVVEPLYFKSKPIENPRDQLAVNIHALTQTLDTIKPNSQMINVHDSSLVVLSEFEGLIEHLKVSVVAQGLMHWIEDLIIKTAPKRRVSGDEENFSKDHYWDRVRTLKPTLFITGAKQSSRNRQIATTTGAFHLLILDQIVIYHPVLHKRMASLYVKMFEQNLPRDFEISLQLDIKKCILDRIVFLISRGFISFFI